MTILARLAALEATVAAQSAALAAHGDTLTSFATTTDLSAVNGKVSDLASSVDAIEAEIGTDPAPTPAPDASIQPDPSVMPPATDPTA